MQLVKIPPPGTFCFYDAVFDMLKSHEVDYKDKNTKFLEVGCGEGDLSKILLQHGCSGMGVDFSAEAIQLAKNNLNKSIDEGRYTLLNDDILLPENIKQHEKSFDLSFSMMVMEHVEDDVNFIENISCLTKNNGFIMLAVPGRMDRWGIEDETVGHLRRYERSDLKEVMEKAGLKEVAVWSVAVPTANLLFNIGNYFVRNSEEVNKLNASIKEQTQSSGIREIPFKTVFPPWFKIFLNKFTLFPLFVVQRIFYRSNLGLTMLAIGRVSE